MIEIPVSDVMRRPVRTIDPEASVVEAAKELYERDVGSLVVTSEGDETPAGIVTKSDVNVVVARGRDPTNVTVGEIMSSPVVTVRASEPIRTAAERMRTNSIKKLPVTDDDGRLIGVVAAGDLAYYLPTYTRRVHSRRPGPRDG